MSCGSLTFAADGESDIMLGSAAPFKRAPALHWTTSRAGCMNKGTIPLRYAMGEQARIMPLRTFKNTNRRTGGPKQRARCVECSTRRNASFASSYAKTRQGSVAWHSFKPSTSAPCSKGRLCDYSQKKGQNAGQCMAILHTKSFCTTFREPRRQLLDSGAPLAGTSGWWCSDGRCGDMRL
jgi:hypothetical protein